MKQLNWTSKNSNLFVYSFKFSLLTAVFMYFRNSRRRYWREYCSVNKWNQYNVVLFIFVCVSAARYIYERRQFYFKYTYVTLLIPNFRNTDIRGTHSPATQTYSGTNFERETPGYLFIYCNIIKSNNRQVFFRIDIENMVFLTSLYVGSRIEFVRRPNYRYFFWIEFTKFCIYNFKINIKYLNHWWIILK